MKKSVYILALVLFPLLGMGQSYFNVLVPDTQTFSFGNVSFSDSGYLALGSGFNPIYRSFFVYNFNLQGEVKNYHSFGTAPMKYFGDIVSEIEGGYVVCGTVQDSASNLPRDPFVVRFNHKGEVVWYTRITDYKQDDFLREQIISKDQAKIYIAGLTRSFGDSEGDFLLTALDSSGNVKWEKTYGTAGFYEECRSIIQTSDGGFVLSGVKDTPNREWDIWVVKTDSLGNKEWDKTYGESFGDFGGFTSELLDGNLLLLYNSDSASNNTTTRLKLLRLSIADGQVLWDKSSAHHRESAVMNKAIINHDSTFVVCGGYKPLVNNRPRGVVWKFSPKGDLIWSKEYYTQDDDVQYIYDIKATPDSGFIFCGSAVADDNDQYGWLVKLDCFGNDSITYYQEGACEVYSNITRYQGGIAEQIQLFPNPANSKINIALPQGTFAQQVELLNANGQVVLEKVLSAASSFEVDISTLSTGLYWAKIQTKKGEFYVKKVVVEH